MSAIIIPMICFLVNLCSIIIVHHSSASNYGQNASVYLNAAKSPPNSDKITVSLVKELISRFINVSDSLNELATHVVSSTNERLETISPHLSKKANTTYKCLAFLFQSSYLSIIDQSKAIIRKCNILQEGVRKTLQRDITESELFHSLFNNIIGKDSFRFQPEVEESFNTTETSLCISHINAILDGMRNYEPWTLKRKTVKVSITNCM